MFSFLGLALTYILENSFKPEAGARPGVSKIGILITDGKSQDDVIPPAKNLRDAGIELFAIGVYSALSLYMSHGTLVYLYLLLAVLRKCSFLPYSSLIISSLFAYLIRIAYNIAVITVI